VFSSSSRSHLDRMRQGRLSEFDFGYSNRVALAVDDQDRADKAIGGMVGKRFRYRRPDSAPT
jgi:hypothetical protein